jgi:hypothetical protein
MADENLTGLWHGLFSYPMAGKAGNFSATLIESGATISGSTSEIWASGARAGETVLAMLSGHRNGQSVAFTKTYEGPAKPNHSVEYEGTLTDDCLEIEGRWSISASWGGQFLMIRSFGRSVGAARRAFEQV